MSRKPKDINTVCHIYRLLCPSEGMRVKYVGKTVKPLKRRLSEHIWEADKYHLKSHKSNWIRKLNKLGFSPIVELIETCTWDNSQDREKYWISYYRNLNPNLCNETNGGEGVLGRVMTKETRLKISESHRKIPIYYYTKDKEYIGSFISIQEAARITGSSASKIVACCKNRRNFHNNYIWSYTKI
jgi:hypothetical protein